MVITLIFWADYCSNISTASIAKKILDFFKNSYSMRLKCAYLIALLYNNYTIDLYNIFNFSFVFL